MSDSETQAILEELRRLNEKVDSLASAVDELLAKKRRKAENKKARSVARLAELTPEQAGVQQSRFTGLYERWRNNEEAAVREELEAMSADDLRLFADANNLNVTAKTPKDKVIHLIGIRFREKKQLMQNLGRNSASSPS